MLFGDVPSHPREFLERGNLVQPGHGQKQSRLQERAIVCLLTQPTIEAAAAEAGVAYRTLIRMVVPA
jgi:hypothetical protein